MMAEAAIFFAPPPPPLASASGRLYVSRRRPCRDCRHFASRRQPLPRHYEAADAATPPPPRRLISPR